ncbi:pentatricopeptide repeat-containing protein At5g66520 isoform X1 [Lactuca sativa]|uniref:pentatricopeptide repeat-containing protein At5g66520 isoform X1 n=1 Tax=Lactuca sativa TaxID=4236 RepID=UPI000CD7FA5D|nr:pentatricopeptide repeat-containing protein At5g66520 isoform X1 [Lactuca sativa]
MLEIMPINGLSMEPAKLPSFPYATKNGGSKNKSRRSLRCTAVIINLPTNYPPKGNNTLINRFVMSNPKPNALDSSKKGLHLLKLHEGLESCSTMEELKQYHSQIIKLGLSYDNDAIGRIIKFCAISKNGDLGYALKVFDNLPKPDAFIYNTIFRGYLQFQHPKECISLYSQMLQSSVTPNKFSFPPVTRACSLHNAIEEGKQVHAQILKFGYSSDGFSQNNLIHMYVTFKNLQEARKVFDKMPRPDPISWTTLITGYSQLGYINEARKVFDKMPERNPVSWNAMISAYVQSNRFHEALQLFNKMQSNHIKLDKFVAASMLSACTKLGALKQGEWIHDYIKRNGIQIDPKLASTIIDMYCKCGSLEKALETFNELTKSKSNSDSDSDSVSVSISSWNSMIGGFAMHGKGDSAIDLFKKMETESVSPDYITFVNLLSACAHSGLIEQGRYYFKHMVESHGITPGMEHYGCMVDMLGRAGMFDSAIDLINEMPMNPDVGVMGALLGACKIHNNVELGEKIGEKVIELEPHNSGRYVLLANIYANSSKWESVAKIRKLMNDRGVKKEPGFSQIEIEGSINEFIAGGRVHRDSKQIYEKVNEMLTSIKSMGYEPESENVLHDISEEEEDVENPVFYHSEKLAIAYGLLKSKPGEVLRITKNLRVCKDCHEVSKLVSKCFEREIIVRDRSRFHHFKDGVCSCNDYW